MATILNRGPNKWILMVSDGFNANGDRRRFSKQFNGTEKQAMKAAVLFEQEIKQGQYCELSKKFTLNEFVELWLRDYGEKQLAPKTLARYKSMLDSRILPFIGHLRLDKIKPITINRWLNDISEMPRLDNKDGKLSPQTIKHHFRCLSSILQDAVQWDIIPSNPCLRVKPPQVEKQQIQCYDEEQTRDLLVALEKQSLKHKTLIHLAIASGARQGEIMGLEWKHIDFQNNTISIEQASQYLPGKGTFTKSPKNQSSIRIISMPQNVMDLIKSYRAEWIENRIKAGNLWQGSERLFTTWDGKPAYPGWPSKWFNSFLKKEELPPVPFHSLRHLSATLLIKDNIPIKNISKRLGHTVTGTTADIYAHALKSVDRTAADMIGKALEIKINKQKQSKQI